MAKRSPRLIFTEEERTLPELERAVRKADRAAGTETGDKAAGTEACTASDSSEDRDFCRLNGHNLRISCNISPIPIE